MKLLAASTAEGSPVRWIQEDDLRVHCLADADIDADGANGQAGAPAAYRSDDHGSEALANGGMGLRDGKTVFTKAWGKDIVLLDERGGPLVLPTGIIPSKTAYRWPHLEKHDPAAYVDSETVPYIVVPPEVRLGASGIVLGCRARITRNRNCVSAVVADIGPRNKAGEISIAAARALGLRCSPRSGGTDKVEVLYELWPGTPALVNGVTYPLLRSGR